MDQTIKKQIIEKLHEQENIHAIKIPLAIESGSRGWGFASPDSDYDCRFIYVHKKNDYLTVFPKKDVLESEVNAVFDINGWDLKKVILHLVKSNAVMLEWLSSNEIYFKDEKVAHILNQLGEKYFNPF